MRVSSNDVDGDATDDSDDGASGDGDDGGDGAEDAPDEDAAVSRSVWQRENRAVLPFVLENFANSNWLVKMVVENREAFVTAPHAPHDLPHPTIWHAENGDGAPVFQLLKKQLQALSAARARARRGESLIPNSRVDVEQGIDDDDDDEDDDANATAAEKSPSETRVKDTVAELEGQSMAVLLTIDLVLGLWHLWQHSAQKNLIVFSASSFENIARISGDRNSPGKLRFFSSVGHIRTIWREIFSQIVAIDQFFMFHYEKSASFDGDSATTLDFDEWVDGVCLRASPLKILREAVHTTFIGFGFHSFMRAGASTMILRHLLGLLIELDGVANGHRYLNMLAHFKFQYHTMSDKTRVMLHNVMCVDLLSHFAGGDEFTELLQYVLHVSINFTGEKNFESGVNRVGIRMPYKTPTNRKGSTPARAGMPAIGSTLVDVRLVEKANALLHSIFDGLFTSGERVVRATFHSHPSPPRNAGYLARGLRG